MTLIECPSCGEIWLEESKWIPTKERLPNEKEIAKDRGYFWVTLNGNVVKAHFFAAHFYYRGNITKNASAWQPLPEPYRKPTRLKRCPESYNDDDYTLDA